jgi:CheY-like chemotaxis protein
MTPALPAPPPPACPSDPERPRVAVCEPDPLLHALLDEWLRRAGFQPVRCAAGEVWLDVTLVVADVAAPRRHGGACIAVLRQSFPRARVLAISAQFIPGLHGHCTAAIELGADAVLAKPFEASLFIEAMHALAAAAKAA